MVGRFIKQCLLLSIPVLAMLVAYCGMNSRYFPAPRISDNISMNEKAMLLNQRKTQKVRVLALGSSMSQVNLSTNAVLEHFEDTAYFNFSSWGMDIIQNYELAQRMVPGMKPKTYILTSNLMDFSKDPGRADFDPDKVADLALGGSVLKAYLRRPVLAYYLREMETNKIRFNDRSSYECLMYDSHGGVSLNVTGDRLNQTLMDQQPPKAATLDSAQYAALNELCGYLEQQDIELIFLQAPYRAGLLTPEVERTVALHVEKIKAIVDRHGHQYADTQDIRWADSLYCDATHFNKKGAYLYSKEVLGRLR